MSCAARRQNDQMACGPCGVTWDLNDPEPPSCGLACTAAADPDLDEDAIKYAGRAMSGRGEVFRRGDVLSPDFDDDHGFAWERANVDGDFDAGDLPLSLIGGYD